MSNDNLDITISVRNREIFQNDRIMSLLENLGVDITQLNEETEAIIISNGGEKVEVINHQTEVNDYCILFPRNVINFNRKSAFL